MIIIADDFTPQWESLRVKALGLDYRTVHHNGHDYQGVGAGYSPRLTREIESVVGFPVKIRMEFFRAGTSGMKPDTFIHADMDCGAYAGVLYLNQPDQRLGGTAFWRNKKTGSATYRGPSDLPAAMEGWDESKWDMDALVKMGRNRFVCYPTNYFHSRYPNIVEAPSVEVGRLVWAVFFDRA